MCRSGRGFLTMLLVLMVAVPENLTAWAGVPKRGRKVWERTSH